MMTDEPRDEVAPVLDLDALKPTRHVATGERAWPAAAMNAYIDERNALLEEARNLKRRVDALERRPAVWQ